ncbi:MAG TPA: fluoride efflux transporter CrcB [Flavisolibacter sp.]|nr:fluoride efflux transporter CrcB [Flavisolibacter sp.]
MMPAIFLVAFGGALGSVCRYLLQRQLNSNFPYGTLLVNLLGCLLIGFLWGLFARNADEQKRLLWMSGFCGGFTTFSAFGQESIQLLMDNRWLTFALYTTASLAGGLLVTYLGFKLTH